MLMFINSLNNNQSQPPPPTTSTPLLLIMDGQSNNGGQGEVSELPQYLTGAISNKIKIWDGSNISTLQAGVNNNGQMILSAGGVWTSSWHGAELELAYRLNEEWPNRDIYFVKTGRGGRPLYQSGIEDFSENSTGELHQYLIDNVTNFLTAYGDTIDVFETWYLWDQGEYDCRTGNDVMTNAYEVNLGNKLDAVKTALSLSNFNIVGRVLSTNQTARDIVLLPIVRQAQINVLSTYLNANYVLSETYTLKADALHFNSAGQISKGFALSQVIINN